MKVIDITEVELEFLDFANLHPHPWRPYQNVPNHIGVAAVVRHVAQGYGKWSNDDAKEHERRKAPWRMLLGMGWEAMAAQLYPKMFWQPKVLTLDGVQGHPDGYSLVGKYGVVDEFKLTARSLRVKGGKPDRLKDIRQEWVWMAQVMAYCKMASIRTGKTMNYAQFHVLWAMGVYDKFTMDERYLRYLVEFTDAEIESNWNLLIAHRDEAMAEELGR